MKFLLSAMLTLVFSYCLRGSIKKHGIYYYVGATILSLYVVFGQASALPAPLATVMSTLFQYGTVATAMISIVMYANAFPNGSIVQKTFMPIRGELSIIACILIYGHNLFTGKTYFKMLLNTPEKMSTATVVATLLTVVLLLMMTPLFVTSFKTVRRKMKAKSWKKLQRMAYVFYMLIYVHIMCLMLPLALKGKTVYVLDVVVYSVVFLGYATMRLHKYYQKSKKLLAIGLIVAMYVTLGAVLLCQMVEITPSSSVEASVENSVVTEDGALEEVETEEESPEALAPEAVEEMLSPYDIDLSLIPDGTYQGEGEGYSGTIYVTVTMADGAIEKITLDSHTDDEEYMASATWMRKYIIDGQSKL